MSNEHYLIVSYAAVGALVLLLALLVWLFLRRSFGATVEAAARPAFACALRRLFGPGIVLPALAGFLSVAYRSCSKTTYESIVTDRAYLVAKNQEQIATSLHHTVIAIVGWACIILALLIVADRSRSKTRPATVGPR